MPRHYFGIFLFFLLCGFSSFAQITRPQHQLLWQISGNGLNSPSYLYATIVSQDKRAFEFSDSVIWAFEQCEKVAVSIHSDSMFTVFFDRYFKEKGPNKTLQKVLTEPEYKKISQRLYRWIGHTLDETNISNPRLLRSLMSQEKSIGNLDYTVPLHEYFLRIAQAKKKAVISLEQLEDITAINLYSESEISDIFMGMPSENAYNPGQYESDSAYQESLIQTYRTGELDAYLKKIVWLNTSEREQAVHNRIMLESLKKQLPLQSLFIPLDLYAMVGPEGMLSLLRGAGYTVRPISATFTGRALPFEYQPKNIPWVYSASEKFGFAVELPMRDKTVNRNFDLTADGFQCVDFASGISYYALGTRASLDRANTEEALLNQFLERYPELPKIKNSNNKKNISISQDGKTIPGLDIIFAQDKNNDRPVRMQIFIRDKQYIYINVVESYENVNLSGKEAERFFKSLKFLPLPAPDTLAWVPVERIAEGYRFQSIGTPDFKEKMLSPTDSNSAKALHHTFFDPEEGTSFIVHYTELPNGNYYETRKFIFDEIESAFQNKEVKLLSEKEIVDSAFVGKEYRFEDNMNGGLLRVIYRGSHNILLAVNHKKENFDSVKIQQFLNSFEFLPHPKAELKSYTAPTKDYVLQIPKQEMLPERGIDPKSYFVTDPASGIVFEVCRLKVPDYVHFTDQDSLSRWVNKLFLNETDSVLWQQPIAQYAPYDAFEWGVLPKDWVSASRVRVIYVGNTIYILRSFSAPCDLHAEVVFQVFNSFQIKNASPKRAPTLATREEVILNFFENIPLALKKRTWTYQNDLYKGYLQFDFRPEELPYFTAAIEALSVRDSFAAEALDVFLRQIPDSANIDELLPLLVKQSQADYMHKEEVWQSILDVLSFHPSEKTKALFKELYFNPKSKKNTELGLLGAYVYKNIKEAGFLFPEIVKQLEDENSPHWLYSFIGNAIDSAGVSPTVLDSYWPIIEKQFKAEYAELQKAKKKGNKEEEDLYEKLNFMHKYILLFKHQPVLSGAIANILQKMLAQDCYYYIKQRVIETLLHHRIKPNSKEIEKMLAKDMWVPSRLYEVYKLENKLDWFPKQFQTQLALAKSKFIDWLDNEGNMRCSKIEFVEKIPVNIKGKEGWAYCFKFAVQDWNEQEEDTWHLALFGFYSDDKSLDASDETSLPFVLEEPIEEGANMTELKTKLKEEFISNNERPKED